MQTGFLQDKIGPAHCFAVIFAHEGLSAGVQMARSKKACLVFFDEIDAIGGARFDDGAG